MTEFERDLIGSLNEVKGHLKGETILKTTKVTFEEAPEYSPAELKAIRSRVGLSQVRFAHLMAVSPKTVEAWEKGTNAPNGPSRRLLSIFSADPSVVRRFQSN